MMLPLNKRKLLVISLIYWFYLLQVTVSDDTSSSTQAAADAAGSSTPSLPIIDDSDDEIKIEEDDSEILPVAFKSRTAENKDAKPKKGPELPRSSAATAIAKLYEALMITKPNGTREDRQNNSGATSNATKPIKTTVACLPRELLLLNENDTSRIVEPTVEIVNFTSLIQDILLINTTIKTKTTPANCTIVYFYAHWCKFSAKAAAHVNALARVFPSIQTVAIDCSLHSTVNSHFGVLSVPTMLLFHNGKTIAKFNDTTFTLNKFAEFIQYYTDQKCDEKLLNVTSKDFQGPISSTPSQERDIWLLLAWIFIIVCFVYYTSRSILWRRVVDLIRTTWREAEAQHEHID